MSTTRRAFIRNGIGAGAMVAVTPSMSMGCFDTVSTTADSPRRAIYDERFSNARAFGIESGRLGMRAVAMSGNVHDLWYRDLAPLWQQEKASISGMTDFRALFLLDMMASDAGLRVVHRIHHVNQPAGETTHHIYGPLAARAQWQIQLDDSGSSWSGESALICARWRNDRNSTASNHSDIAAARDQGLDSKTLVSWVIAARAAI